MRTHDLIVLGAGMGNALVDDRFAHLDVAIVSEGPFGGTCLNAGCIPSKMLAATADVADTVRDAHRHDVDAELRRVRWADARERVFGRRPNGDRLGLDAAGIDAEDGRITVDEQLRTSAEGVWALGDVSTPVPLKHVANRGAEVVAHNLIHPGDPRTMSYDAVPAAVFTRPQIAQVGLTEQEAREQGLDYAAATHRYEDVAYGWALEETQGFCKVLVDRGTGRLLGAHLLGPQAATLIQPLVVAQTFGITARDLAEQPLWIHPALTEVAENALRELDSALTSAGRTPPPPARRAARRTGRPGR
ncbi:FAD-dependent oxidoreductase [Streptomyces sp. NPDC090023]|uniref:FAD-dependent oxidoreductase n=1 Tax=unclassified Streptomyces TaxID=2593676 RepID=UPI00380A887D